MPAVHHRYANVDGHRLFFREAGDPQSPTVVLLHGFPTSSYMFRALVPALADSYHVIAPDHLGFGLSDAPPVGAVTRSSVRPAQRLSLPIYPTLRSTYSTEAISCWSRHWTRRPL
ncbi:hypothetical protein GCM10009641_43290 [Mycobacterium cookii]|uniref:AB hydrolase-1 domain-containing protein n=1 Tax=Mycobacterium cookii TaxID=1775 RepID=A0A7I7KYF7_9MYCO|nr:hypothetical protein MCOO_25330 [Mycobacterium cookii]